jgi:hypothetical protein
MQLDEAGLRFVMKNLKAMGREIPAELLAHIELVVKKVYEVKAQLQDMAMGYAKAATSKESSAYQAKMRGLEKEIDTLYTSFETLYGKAIYGDEKEKTRKSVSKYK